MPDTPHRSFPDPDAPWPAPSPADRNPYGNQHQTPYGNQHRNPYGTQHQTPYGTWHEPPHHQPQPQPHHQPHPAPDPARLTYPWAPPPPPPAPARRLPRHPLLGRHSDLRLLRVAYRRQRRVATLTALGYFTLFLLLSAFAPSLMTGTLPGGLSTGLLLGLCQLPVTGLALCLYECTARRRVDPLAHRLRRQAELDHRPMPGTAGGALR
ncbi:DUF485 domain-containing protein [Streptomyces sp. NPDC058067]|uniref:DUF485 domain-containing protein n=1 Tax=Streptomyces sp. NPDC058067 TaxID=3346324 RepID=UPI0036EAC757